MNVPMEPTTSSQQLSGQCIYTQSASNYKSNLADPNDSLQFIDNNLQKGFSDAFNSTLVVIYKPRKEKRKEKQECYISSTLLAAL